LAWRDESGCMSRISFTETEKREWLGLFENYDWSAAEFCREFSLPYGGFLNWRRELSGLPLRSSSTGSEEVKRGPKFVELVPLPDPGRVGSGESLAGSDPGDQERRGCVGAVGEVVAELELGAGYLLRIYRPVPIPTPTPTPAGPQV
jgi:hypothetical protein